MVRSTSLALVLFVLASAAARADEPLQAATSQRTVGIGVEAGVIGVGAAVRAGTPDVGLYLGASFSPLLILSTPPNGNSLNLDLLGSGDFRADGYWWALKTEKSRFGPMAGFSYNTVLGAGFNLGAAASVTLRRSVDLSLSWTAAFFPQAKDRLAARGFDAADGKEPRTPWLQGGGIAIGLIFYP